MEREDPLLMNGNDESEKGAKAPMLPSRSKTALRVVVMLAIAGIVSGAMLIGLASVGSPKMPARLDGLVGYVSGFIAGRLFVHPCKLDIHSRSPEYRNGVFKGHADSRKP